MFKRVEFTKLFITGPFKRMKVVESLYTSFPNDFAPGIIRSDSITGDRYIITHRVVG